jgi:septal ring factor EnvC (AmiA/AmiB activator)
MWDWGEDGVCCDDHRQWLQTRSGQLTRSITFSKLGRSEYTPPKLREMGADEGLLKTKLAEEMTQRKALEQQIAKLESEREANIAKMREQELRVQDLLKQVAELKAELASLELTTSPEAREVVEGAADEAPATQSTQQLKGNRNR